MATTIRYIDLLTVEVLNEFNVSTDEQNSDLEIVPTQDTINFMQRQRIIFKAKDNGFRVAVSVKENDEPVIPLPAFTFRFSVQVKGTKILEWLNVTDLKQGGMDYARQHLVYYRTKPQLSNLNLKYELLNGLRPSVFTFQTAANNDNLRVQDMDNNAVDVVFDGDGNALSQPYDMIEIGTGEYELGLDFTKLKPGRYKLKYGGGTDFYYVDTELFKKQPFGALDLRTADTTGAVVPRNYKMNFKNRETIWRYIVVNKSGISTNDFAFAILDTLGQKAPYKGYLFEKVETRTVNGYPADVFESKKDTGNKDEIPFFDTPKAAIELQKIDLTITGETETLITNLANPSLTGVSTGDDLEFSDVYVYV